MADAKHSGVSADSQVMNRRNLLAAAPLAALSAAIAAGNVDTAAAMAVETTETPVMRAYREWLTFHNWLETETGGMDDSDFDDLCDKRRKMEVAIYDLPSQGPSDVLLKLLVLNDNGNDFSDDGMETGIRLLAEARALVGA